VGLSLFELKFAKFKDLSHILLVVAGLHYVLFVSFEYLFSSMLTRVFFTFGKGHHAMTQTFSAAGSICDF